MLYIRVVCFLRSSSRHTIDSWERPIWQSGRMLTKVQAYRQGHTLRKPYSVKATKATGAVEMNTPAIGMKLQMNTNKPNRPMPGICRIHRPRAVNAVLAIAI